MLFCLFTVPHSDIKGTVSVSVVLRLSVLASRQLLAAHICALLVFLEERGKGDSSFD